jgi:hypothetical protein
VPHSNEILHFVGGVSLELQYRIIRIHESIQFLIRPSIVRSGNACM